MNGEKAQPRQRSGQKSDGHETAHVGRGGGRSFQVHPSLYSEIGFFPTDIS